MTEKSKNDQPRMRRYGCGIILLLSIVCLSFAVYALRESFKGGFGFGPGAADYCMSTEGVHHDFDLAGRVVDAQGEPIQQAQVEIGSEGIKSCVDEVTSYSTTTNESGEFWFRPILFAYTDEFFISINAKGCKPSVTYDDIPSSEVETIILDCTPAPTQ